MDTTRCVVVALVLVAALGPAGVGTAAAQSGDCAFPITRTDATGTDVTVGEDPDEVVTLNPSAAQTMYEIDAWEEVVGVSTYASYLPGADDKTTVGTGNSDATVEQTLALDPDLVLAPNTIDGDVVTQLRDAGVTVYKFEMAEDLDDVVEKTRLTGELVGHCESADSRADEMERQLDVVREAVEDVDRPKVFYTFFGFTAGEGTFIHEVIQTAGGDNVADDSAELNANGVTTSGYYDVNAEYVVAANPEWFVLNGDEYDTATVPAGPGGIYEGTTAYREGNAVVLDANEISQPAPRIVNAILDLVRVLHPEAYESEIEGRVETSSLGDRRGTTAERLADGSLSLQASNLGRSDRVSFDVPPRPNATASVRRVNVTLATVNPTFELRLRHGGDVTPPNGTRTLETVGLSGNGVFAGDVDHLTLRLAVNRSRLDGADPDTVTLFRSNGTGWVPLRTTRVTAGAANGTADAATGGNATAAAANDTLVYEARTTGFATLLLAVEEPDSPAEPATNGTAVPTATATATAEPTPTGTGEFRAATTEPPASTPTPTPTPGSAPGFGPLLAVAAVLLAAAGVRR
ncbi:PGF-CTERM-anchored ABC transporter substrate-binding protein [Haloplanus halophilus]|uniref:PGF-CTERM-anchored ABC transporter substrate-binding protein n=1 Tax=Haloplanus halophilus TaxID=2949993 RepID=UPI00203F99C6|nr:PGF-CTERM-anchored ABC transporter substrate-binding protein [Haloplanus sp. GDY1]